MFPPSAGLVRPARDIERLMLLMREKLASIDLKLEDVAATSILTARRRRG